jgi:NADH dehydrogenase [ubiquinone] 1 alpha subcomplex assembly factor 5
MNDSSSEKFTPQVFDRKAQRDHRDRAVRRLADHDFLFRMGAERLADRLLDIKRRFPQVLDLGCRGGSIADALAASPDFGITRLVQADISSAMAARAHRFYSHPTVVCDEELLPFRSESFDLILSNLSLHWVNDLPGSLIQIRQSLRPDGLFCASLFGAGTLSELRDVFLEAEMDLKSGVSLRISPFAEVRDLGGLLQRAGFSLPVVDTDKITVTFTDAFHLMADLRGMGETNTIFDRQKTFTGREIFAKAAALYAERYGMDDGRIPASFHVITLTAWAPHASQPKPLRRGSATASLADALGERTK